MAFGSILKAFAGFRRQNHRAAKVYCYRIYFIGCFFYIIARAIPFSLKMRTERKEEKNMKYYRTFKIVSTL